MYGKSSGAFRLKLPYIKDKLAMGACNDTLLAADIQYGIVQGVGRLVRAKPLGLDFMV